MQTSAKLTLGSDSTKVDKAYLRLETVEDANILKPHSPFCCSPHDSQ